MRIRPAAAASASPTSTTAESFRDIYDTLVEDKKALAATFNLHDTIDYAEIRAQYEQYAEKIRPMVCDTAALLNDAIAPGQARPVRRRAGHACSISITAPIRSSLLPAPRPVERASAPASRPRKIEGIIGISKAYNTRVGSGPFPTESTDATGDLLRREGNEFGAVTGRPRRCGWFDVPLLRYTAMVNGFDTLFITKLDVLDNLDEIPVCVALPPPRRGGNGNAGHVPRTRSHRARLRNDARLENVDARHLPVRRSAAEARAYLKFLEDKTGVEVGGVSTGPERTETIIRAGSKLERLIG